jgi:H/ACA ribonucleoprotein complex non-core subunit NAF1
MYSIRFPSVSSIDPTIHYPQRKVFHVPRHSSYVFTKEIKHLKGSDASNVYDEEVDADEAEFSDDEQEANAKTL